MMENGSSDNQMGFWYARENDTARPRTKKR